MSLQRYSLKECYYWKDLFNDIEKNHVLFSAYQLQYELRTWFIKHYVLTSYLCITDVMIRNIHKYSWPTQIKEWLLFIHKEYGEIIIDMENNGELYHKLWV